ncbi:MAG: ferritin-like domain-containing protein, partial [Methylocella sp.]
MAVKTLEDLFHETLKDLYYVEKKLVKTLPKMAKQAASPELKAAIEAHLAETETHVERLQQVFEEIEKKPVSKKCEALEG